MKPYVLADKKGRNIPSCGYRRCWLCGPHRRRLRLKTKTATRLQAKRLMEKAIP